VRPGQIGRRELAVARGEARHVVPRNRRAPSRSAACASRPIVGRRLPMTSRTFVGKFPGRSAGELEHVDHPQTVEVGDGADDDGGDRQRVEPVPERRTHEEQQERHRVEDEAVAELREAP
jgi:hypothetical protein